MTNTTKKIELEKLCSIITDGTHQTPKYSDTGYIFLSSKNVVGEKIDWVNVKYIPEYLHNELYSRISPQLNDILLAKNGTTGVAALVDKNHIFDIYVSLALLRPTKDVEPKYLLYAINSPSTKRFFNSNLKGIGVPNLHLKYIRKTLIPIYTLEEQKKIATILDKVSNLISLQKQQLEKLNLLIKSRFIEMFGDPITNKKHWNFVSLGNICEILSSKRIFEKEYVNRGIPFYRTKEVVELSKGIIVSTELYISKERYYEIKNKYDVPKKHDLLISAVGTIGTIWIVNTDKPFYFKDGNLLWIKSVKRFNSIYMRELLIILIKYYKKDLSIGTAYSALTIIKLKSMMCIDPPIELQNQFADFVQQVEKKKSIIQQGLDKLELLKKALMQEYFG